jgi:hypothetical protein
MLTTMTESDWAILLQVFRASRGEQGPRRPQVFWRHCSILRSTTSIYSDSEASCVDGHSASGLALILHATSI